MNGKNMPVLKRKSAFVFLGKIRYLLSFIGDFYEKKKESDYMKNFADQNRVLKRYDRL